MPGTLDILGPVDLQNPLCLDNDLAAGLLGRWIVLPGLDGGPQWYDLLGLTNGTLHGGANWGGTTRPGGFGQITFDGSTGYVQWGANPVTTKVLTVSAWARTSAATAVFLETRYGTNNSGVILYAGVSNASFFMSTPTANHGINGNTSVADNVWHHYCGTSDGTTMRLYLDGVLQVSGPTPGGAMAASAEMTSGRAFDSSFYASSNDDICIWNRPLSAAEVWTLYDDSRANYPDTLNRLDLSWMGQSLPGTLALSGPSSGTTDVASTNFTVAATSLSASDTITLHSDSGGTFATSPIAAASGTHSYTFTYTPAADGAHSISITDSLGAALSGSPIVYTSTPASTSGWFDLSTEWTLQTGTGTGWFDLSTEWTPQTGTGTGYFTAEGWVEKP